MFEKLAVVAVQRWPVVLACAALFCCIAYRQFQQLPIEAFPDVTDPMVDVVGVYPGQAAEEVERRVTLELERALAGTPKLSALRSVSVFGLTLLTLTFEEGTPDTERRTAVAERLRDAELPDGAQALMGPQATPVGQIYRYTLRGKRSLRELRALQDFVVERRLRAVPGVADVVTFGGFERQYQVRIDPARLAAMGISFGEMHEALARANENAGGGYVDIGSQELVVRGLGAIDKPSELGSAVVKQVDGVPIRVRDVADIVEGATPRRGSVGRGHNDEVVEGIVLLRRGENPSVVLSALHERVDQLNHEVLPRDVKLVPFYDRTSLVDATLHTVGKNMLEGVLLVLAIVYVFLRSVRAVIIVATVIPVSMLTAFVGLHMLGLPANLISLGAIDFGILVDGAIIVVESTLHMWARASDPGRDRLRLVSNAARSVATPVGFAMSIIVVALGPIFTLQRVEGRIFAPMAFTYAFALLGALLCALLIVPALEAALFRGSLRTAEPRWLMRLSDAYAAALSRLRPVRNRGLAALVLVIVGLGWFGSGIGTEFLPELNEGGFYVTAVFPSTISLDETRQRVRTMREHILSTPEVRDVLSHIGRPEHATQAEGPNNAEFFIVLAPENTWRKGVSRTDLENALRARLRTIPGVQYNFSQPITDRVFETISGIIGQVVVKVRGTNLERMTQLAEDLRQRISHVKGVADLSLYQAGSIPALRIEIERDALARRGLSVDDVQRTIRIALGGEVATELWQDEQRFAVALRLPDAIRTDPKALRQLRVGDPTQGVTLGEVAHIDTSQGRAAIWREDFSRFVAVKFNVRGRDLGSTVADAQHAVVGLPLPEGTYLTWGGEFQNQKRAMRQLSIALPLALAAVLGLLYLNFRRVRPTLAIAAFLPIAGVGAVFGLRVCGERFSVSSAVGCIALLGQVVLAGVTICARIDAARAQGARDPLVEGARDAFRPVVLTTLLALLGLLPAATSHAMGSETQRPFAIAIVTGLALVAPAILAFLPLLYAREPRQLRPVPRKSRRGAQPDPDQRSSRSSLAAVMRRFALWFGLTTLAFTTSLHANPTRAQSGLDSAQTFTLQQAQALLSQGHPRLASAMALERAANSDIVAQGLWTNPELAADYLKGVTHSSYDSFGNAVVSLSQFLELSGVPNAKARSARYLRDVARAYREQVERALYLELEASLIELAAQARIVTLSTQLLTHFERAEKIVQARVAEGVMSGYAARRISLARAEAAADLESAHAEYARLRGAFDVAVGPQSQALSGTPEYALSPLPILSPLPSLLERALSERRDLAMARAAQQSAAADVSVAQRSVMPGLTLRAIAGYGQGPGQWDLGLGVALPLPVLDHGQGSISAAKSRARALALDREAATLKARQQLTAAYQTAQTSLQAAEQFQHSTQGADTGLAEEAQAQFREGRLTILELVDGTSTAQEIAIKRIQLAKAAHLAGLNLRKLTEVGD